MAQLLFVAIYRTWKILFHNYGSLPQGNSLGIPSCFNICQRSSLRRRPCAIHPWALRSQPLRNQQSQNMYIYIYIYIHILGMICRGMEYRKQTYLWIISQIMCIPKFVSQNTSWDHTYWASAKLSNKWFGLVGKWGMPGMPRSMANVRGEIEAENQGSYFRLRNQSAELSDIRGFPKS